MTLDGERGGEHCILFFVVSSVTLRSLLLLALLPPLLLLPPSLAFKPRFTRFKISMLANYSFVRGLGCFLFIRACFRRPLQSHCCLCASPPLSMRSHVRKRHSAIYSASIHTPPCLPPCLVGDNTELKKKYENDAGVKREEERKRGRN